MKLYDFLFKVKEYILKFLLLIGVFVLAHGNFYAKELLIEDVAKEFGNSEMFGNEYSYSVDSVNNTIDIYSDSKKIVTFNYTDEYIEYDNSSVILSDMTEDEMYSNFIASLLVGDIMESVLKLSGYDGKTITDEKILVDSYDKYGIECVTETYSNIGSNEGVSWEVSIDILKYFKISLDTDKIDTLMLEYGTDGSIGDITQDVILGITPMLEAKDITSNSVSLYPSIEVFNDSIKELNCYIYRSTEENGEYEKISDFAVNCLDKGVGIVDRNLEPNKDYYYKAIVVDGKRYSKPLKVTTLSVNKVSDDEIENPKTGIVNYFAIGACMIIFGALTILILKNKNNLNKI